LHVTFKQCRTRHVLRASEEIDHIYLFMIALTFVARQV
jgi:hypothetical protein